MQPDLMIDNSKEAPTPAKDKDRDKAPAYRKVPLQKNKLPTDLDVNSRNRLN